MRAAGRRSTPGDIEAVIPSEPERDDAVPRARPDAITTPQRRLEAILRALPQKELDGLVERMGIRIDQQKRIDKPAQVARALVRLPDVREPTRISPVSAELLRRIAEANGTLLVRSLPAGLEKLVRRGIVYARIAEAPGGDVVELMLPTAFLVQMKSWEGEDPRSLRALLAEAPFETASAIATHYLGRPSTPPIALSLEPAWEVLGDPGSLRHEVERISHQERRLLDQIEQVGGEVDTQELMDLEREPMRVRGAYGVAAGRRGAAFSLEKRGLLFPLHPNRYVIPTEVATFIGAERLREREQRREQIREHVIAEDHLPRRAKFASDPAPLALALTMALSDVAGELKPGVGTPRSLVAKLAHRFGREYEPTALMVALCRAVGLWESVNAAAPPGSLRMVELSATLFETWRRGGAWDEARQEAEMLRVAPEHRDVSPVGVLREMVLDALADLGEGQWVPYSALNAYLRDDPRMGGLERLFERWAKRVGLARVSPLDVAQRIVLESLFVLGAVDLGGADVNSATGSGEISSLALRLTSRGRRCIAGIAQERSAPSEFTEPRKLKIGGEALVAQVLGLSSWIDVTSADAALELDVSIAAVSRGLAEGVQADDMLRDLGALAELPAELRQALDQVGTVIGRGTLAGAAAFLWIDDPEVRRMLLGTPSLAELFVDPSPPGGLLVAAFVDLDSLVRRCRALGVDIGVEESAMRVRSSSAPPPKKSDMRKTVSWRPPPKRRKDA